MLQLDSNNLKCVLDAETYASARLKCSEDVSLRMMCVLPPVQTSWAHGLLMWKIGVLGFFFSSSVTACICSSAGSVTLSERDTGLNLWDLPVTESSSILNYACLTNIEVLKNISSGATERFSSSEARCIHRWWLLCPVLSPFSPQTPAPLVPQKNSPPVSYHITSSHPVVEFFCNIYSQPVKVLHR